MAKKVPGCIATLGGFLRWAEQFNDGQYLFRGVPKKHYKIEASACRRLPEADRNSPVKLLKINQELIEKARLLGHDQLSGHRLFDLGLLAELQHFRAATCLMDFTRNALVALWFACEQISTGKAEGKAKEGKGKVEETDDKAKEADGKVEEIDGKVFAVRIDDPARFKTITSELLEKDIAYFFEEDENGRYPLYQWQPKLQNNRIIAQQSVFIFGGAKIEPEGECIIRRSGKQDLLRALDKLAGITDATIYPDSDGFARLHVHNNPDFEPDPQGYLQRGIEAHQKGERKEAITYYTTVISSPPDDTAQPPDKDILSWAHHHRGIAYLSEDPSESAVDLAIEDFTKAIQLKTEVIGLVRENPARVRRRKKDLARTYVYRGAAHYWKKDEFDNAMADYTKAIELDREYADAYNYRASSYLSKGDFDNAIADYTKAIDIDQEFAEAYKDRAAAYLGNSDFDSAIADYTKAIQLDPDDTNIQNYRGLAHFRNSEVDKAIDDFSRAIQLKPDDADAYYNRGIVRLSLQNWTEAKSDLTTAINNRLDVATKFQQDYGSVEDFDQRMDIELPEDIVSILTMENLSTDILQNDL